MVLLRLWTASSCGWTMSAIAFLLVVLALACLHQLDAFIIQEVQRYPSYSCHYCRRNGIDRCPILRQHRERVRVLISNQSAHLTSSGTAAAARSRQTRLSSSADKDTSTNQESPSPLTHEDILWKIRLPQAAEGSSIIQRLKWYLRRIYVRLAANLIRFQCLVTGKPAPTLLCPANPQSQVVLQAHVRADKVLSNDEPMQRHGWKRLIPRFLWPRRRWIPIGRFGITTNSGPPIPPILESVKDLYGIDFPNVRTAAIIYMVVEPPYRGRNVGQLALQIISLIHAIQGCDFTILVANDQAIQQAQRTGKTMPAVEDCKLIQWYQKYGNFSVAPKLQEALGSPNGKYGITMMAPTDKRLPSSHCKIQWW